MKNFIIYKDSDELKPIEISSHDRVLICSALSSYIEVHRYDQNLIKQITSIDVTDKLNQIEDCILSIVRLINLFEDDNN